MNSRVLAKIETEFPPAPTQGPWATELRMFTQTPVEEMEERLEAAHLLMRRGRAPGHQMFITEHPHTFVAGARSGAADRLPAAWLEEHGITLFRDGNGERIDYIGPGMLAIYLAFGIDHWRAEIPDGCAEAAEDTIIDMLSDFGIKARIRGHLIDVDGATVGTLRARLRHSIALLRVLIHTNTDSRYMGLLWERTGRAPNIVTMTDLGVPIERQNEVRASWLRHYEANFGGALLIPQSGEAGMRKPPWLRAKMPHAAGTQPVHEIIGREKLHTVCESAHCPNMGECWSHGTATFMINGNVCTRSCSFCAIFTGRPQPIDPDEPRRVAAAAAAMGLKYVVVTAVNRDERADGGAPQFAATIREVRAAVAGARIEVLIPDFKGAADALEIVFRERPDVLNHNVETVPRLYYRVRPQAKYERSLEVLRRAAEAGLVTKSGFMLGLGEEAGEVEQLLRDLRGAGCRIVTIGQYLRPSEKHHPVIRYVTPSEFEQWGKFGRELGFATVESGPLVRSSYHAHEAFGRHEAGDGGTEIY